MSADGAVLLVFAGILLLCLEFNVPGKVVPGAVGVLLLCAGAYGCANLPVHLAWLALAVGGVALAVAGAWRWPAAPVGAAAIAFGLVRALGTSAWVGVSVGLGLSMTIVWLGRVVIAGRRNKRVLGRSGLVGKVGIVRETLQPEGLIEIAGEVWKARLGSGALGVGLRVVVRTAAEPSLLVEPASAAG